MQTVDCVWPVAAELGEGPCWVPSEGALWFVDITAQQIHRFIPESGLRQSWPAPDKVSFILPERSGRFVVGLPGALARFTPATAQFETLLTLERDLPHNRPNDACVDAEGRLWFGSMDDRQLEPTGALYRWDGASPPVRCDASYTISNGPAFSPDGRILYHTETTKRQIYRFDADDEGGLCGKRAFIEIETGAGWPDGTTVDAEGCLWVALWGGSCVRRYSPVGHLLTSIPLPCANVSNLTFGGKDLRTAFVTTARQGLTPDELLSQPLAGGLFAFAVDVPGMPQQAIDLC